MGERGVSTVATVAEASKGALGPLVEVHHWRISTWIREWVHLMYAAAVKTSSAV